jgi:hypothetical protein
MSSVQRDLDLLKGPLPVSRFPVTAELASGPPPEVLAEIDVAWERARELVEA